MDERSLHGFVTASAATSHSEGTTAGISAVDRAATVRALIDETSSPADFAGPGHIFPLMAHPRGVLGRPEHTEAAVDLARLTGRRPSGVICEVANDDDTMARLPEVVEFCRLCALPIITIEELIQYRNRQQAPASAVAA